MPHDQQDDDATSTFSYDGDGDPDTFSLRQLGLAAASHFGSPCELNKLAEGGYHKVCLSDSLSFHLHVPQVYDVIGKDGTVLGVARVASPAFPKDKLESEV